MENTESYLADITFKPRVLIVDDEKRIRDVCYTMLVNEGFEVERAENGEAGLKKIEEMHFDIILLDLMMPGISGLEVLPQIRELHPDTVVIILTGHGTEADRHDCLSLGAHTFMNKPLNIEQLLAIMASIGQRVK